MQDNYKWESAIHSNKNGKLINQATDQKERIGKKMNSTPSFMRRNHFMNLLYQK